MRKTVFPLLTVLLLAPAAQAQNYLYDDREPPASVEDLPTPFSPLKKVAPTQTLRARSNEPFLRDATFSLQPRFYYRSVRNSQGVQDTFAGGGSLGLVTGWWMDFLQIGVVGYTTQPLVAVQNGNRSGLVDADGRGFFTLGQAWVKLRAGPATATTYRQTLNLPFINLNDARMIPNTFEAYQVEADWPGALRFRAGFITQMKARDTAEFVPMSQVAGAEIDRGTAFAALLAGDENEAYAGLMFESTWDLFASTYFQAGKTWAITGEFALRADVQFADQRSVGTAALGDFSTQVFGGRLSASWAGLVATATWTSTARGSDLLNPYGADPAFNMLMISDFALAGEQAIGAGLSYTFAALGLPGLTAFTNGAYGALPGGAWEREVNATVDCRIGRGVLKNFWLRLRYARNERSFSAPIEDFRVILNYSLTF